MADSLYFGGSKMYSWRGRRSYLLPFAIFILIVLSCAEAMAQEDEIPENAAPPPIKLISKEEKSALNGVTDVKDRTKLTLDLMEARLKKAEELKMSESFGAALNELGTFQALMDDALRFLNRNNTGRGKILDNFRRFEIALRGFTPRIETIRREVPERYEYHVRRLLKTVRDARSKAVEPMFADTVVSGN
jgi:hypothetical protein